MTTDEIETPLGVLRVESGERRIVWIAVVETEDGPIFPANALVSEDGPINPPRPHGRKAPTRAEWLEGVWSLVERGARDEAARIVAAEVAPVFLDHIRSLEDVSYQFTSDDPDDVEGARANLLRGLEDALRTDDGYVATKVLERGLYFGSADERLVDLFRTPQALGRMRELAADPALLRDSAMAMEKAMASRSQMIAGMVGKIREASRATPEGAPRP